MTAAHTYEVAIVGAGFAGIGTAIRLLQNGIDDFVILERGDHIGGTWRDNTYPGAACDIPSLLYSYSFAPNPRWSQGYSGSGEILDYITHLVARYDLERRTRFGTEVAGLRFDETTGTWALETNGDNGFRARSVVMAAGPLSNAGFPDIAGIDSYRGHKIHSARWDHDYDFTGKRVAVIGTGASAVQIIPELVKLAGHVKVFQRTPGWVTPRLQYTTPEIAKKLFAAVPPVQTLVRTALFYAHEAAAVALVWPTAATTAVEGVARLQLRLQVKDAWMRRQLTPRFRAGCKRMLVSNDYYPALQKDNCQLITWPIAELRPQGIATCDGLIHEFDAIVFATGFEVCKTGTPFPITGLGGRVLAQEWTRGAYAYKSVHVSGYPNLHFTFGPNSGPGHNSALVYMESQIDYLVQAVKTLRTWQLRYLDVRAQAEREFVDDIQSRLAGTTWNSGCSSWYLTEDGYNATMYPGFATQFARQMAEFSFGDYHAVR